MPSTSDALITAVMDRLEYFSDIPIPYGCTYDTDLEARAKVMIKMIDDIRLQETKQRKTTS